MVRKIVADTPLNDINAGSALLTLLEAAAQVDFENSASILSVLELLNIDATRNNDLDTRGADYGLTRIPAQRSTGFVTITDSSITKRSTGLYQVKNPPIAGTMTIYVNDASSWSPTGNLFIGRGTASFEGPIAYTGIVNNGTFFTITLGSALQKDHLISDLVVDAQGTTDRIVFAGTPLFIPANNQSPAIEFSTLRDAVIPAGEDKIEQVPIISALASSSSNAGINTITNFFSPPFLGATVTNTKALTDGADVETDDNFRERIKSYSSTLARGTVSAIVNAVIGVSDTEDGKQVSSATIIEPPKVGDPSILYIDDRTGFQPTFDGQSVDTLLNEASGKEEFLQLAKYPLPRPQAINTIDGPFELVDDMELKVLVDGNEESVVFTSSDFRNISAATVSEVIIAINNQATTFKATFTDNSSKILLFPVDYSVETIQVAKMKSTDVESLFANNVLKFPTNEYSHIRLYHNNELLKEKEKSATLLTTPFYVWNILASGTLILSVDGTPAQSQSFDTTDFGGIPFSSLTLNDWVAVFNKKFAGITATATSSGRVQFASNKEGALSSLLIEGGSYYDRLFSNQDTYSVGQNSDFQLNRQTGNIRITREITAGDTIEAGTADAKGSYISGSTLSGTFNVSNDGENRSADMLIVSDASSVSPRTDLGVAVGNILTITDEGSDVMRITSNSLTSFAAAQVRDFLYITGRGIGGWLNPANCGLFRIVAKGAHTAANSDSYIEVKNISVVPESGVVLSTDDIHIFGSDKYPQLWKGSFATNPPSAAIQDIVSSLEKNLVNINASIFRTKYIKLTSSTEDNGSIAVPVSTGNAELLFSSMQPNKQGNQSHIANKISSKDVVSYFKTTAPTNEDADGVPNKKVWLDRVTYSDISGELTASVEPGTEGVDTYSEELQASDVLDSSVVDYDDVINNLSGNNKGHYRSIRDKLAGSRIGTQHVIPRTLMDYSSGDKINLMRPNAINSEDSVVLIVDQDAVAKTLDIKMSRKGKVNTAFPPTNLSFSADDSDNEAGITFSSLQVWSKTVNNTDFKDYAVWFRSRNWYASSGATSGLGGSMLVRAREFGPHGDKYRFRIVYPSSPNQTNSISHVNTPDYTLSTYVFGSGPVKNINLSAGDQFNVSLLSGNEYRLTFTNPGIDLSSVLVGDIISFKSDSGISANNRGDFRIRGVSDVAKTIDILNPNASITGVGSSEESKIETTADIVGTKTVSIISNVLDTTSITDNSFFKIYDAAGAVAVVYDKNSSIGTPASYGANRVIRVALSGGESAATVAALTAGVIDADSQFSAGSTSTTVAITNASNGALAIAVNGSTPTGFSFAGTVGSSSASIDGKYFIIPDSNGTVAFWYDVTGITPEPLHGANRAVRINTVNAGDSANVVATKTAVIINNDSAYAFATVLLNVITVEDAVDGGRTGQSSGTSGFNVYQSVNGINSSPETVVIPTSVNVYPLTSTGVADIVGKINSDSIVIYAVAVDDSLPIDKSTADEEYVPLAPNDYSISLSYGHDPDPINGLNSYINLYDGINWVKQFENLSPNFTLKQQMILQGVTAPSVYSVDSAPNHDSGELGEYFKLVPVTLNNIKHHFTQKALSQLPIVADVSIASAIKNIQIKSKQLGSNGAIEVVGGNANNVELSIFGEGQIAQSSVAPTLEIRTASFPVTLTKGDYVEITNSNSAKRISRLTSADTLDAFKGLADKLEYRWNAKDTQFGPYVKWGIETNTISPSYGRDPGYIWRWTFSDSGSYFNIEADVNGVELTAPTHWNSSSSGFSTNLKVDNIDSGSVTSKQKFSLSVAGIPNQADYFTFSGSGTNFAVWFDKDNNGTQPTGLPYSAVGTVKIEVDISTGDTENEVVSALSIALSNNATFLSLFDGVQTQGANLSNVNIGDLLCVQGNLSTNWSHGNRMRTTGDGKVSGFCIVGVDVANRSIDVVNPYGSAMVSESVGSGSVKIVPSPLIKWNLGHSAKTIISQIATVALSTTRTVTTETEHMLEVGDTVTISDNTISSVDIVTTVVSISGPTSFTYSDVAAITTANYVGGTLLKNGKVKTKYSIESLGFNNLYKLNYISGDAPRFIDCGAAVDDTILISGSTFKSVNSGLFKILGVTNSSVIFKNDAAVEQLDTVTPFNGKGVGVIWTPNSNIVSGTIGSFKNVQIGVWVKKQEDADTMYRQVVGRNGTSFSDATEIYLGSNYAGTSAISTGILQDQTSDIGGGIELQNMDDIQIFEGDSAMVGDQIFIDNLAHPDWFSSVNAGSYAVVQVGTTSDGRPFIRVNNPSGLSETSINMSVSLSGVFILEGAANRFSSIRKVEHTSINTANNRRQTYLSPATRVYKVSQSYGTTIKPIGKLGYANGVITGVDGYTFYTGLMRTVQRIVDGYEPDPITYPGRRAVGGVIETLPPLIKRLSVALQVTTNEGVNLNDITDNIKSTIVGYVNTLGVGNDAILAEITVKIMSITGVQAVTVSSPLAENDGKIAIADNERAYIELTDISVA